MCGRYAASRNPDDLVEEFEIVRRRRSRRCPPSYNVAPTEDVYAVLERTPRGEPEAAAVRALRVVRWGLVPSWAKDPSIGNRLINARMETVADKPAFRRAFAQRRCLLPADGYFEWYGETKGKRSSRSSSARSDGGVLAMAGLYELWRDPTARDDVPRPVAVDLHRAHHRGARRPRPHPRPDAAAGRAGPLRAWLDPTRDDPDELASLLVPAAPGPARGLPGVHRRQQRAQQRAAPGRADPGRGLPGEGR